MLISQKRMNKLLDKFTKAVEEKQYTRIPYPNWKKLKSAGDCRIKLITNAVTGEIFIALVDEKSNKTVLEFDTYDKSFGEFLLKEHLSEGEIKTMPPASNSYHSYYGDSVTEYATASNALSSITVNSFDRVYDYNTGTSLSGTYVTKSEFEEKLATKEDKKLNSNKENKMKGFNFDFGPCNNIAVKMSLYGLAVKNSSGTWVSYNPKEDTIIDVDIINFDGAKYLYKIPTAIKDIAAGDIVVHAGKPMFVTSIGVNAKSLHVVDPISGEKKEVMLTRSPFGFDFATKIVNCLGNFMDSAATPDNPFGNIWMLMLATGEDNNISNLAPLMLMNNGAANINPMMMYFLLSGNNTNDSLLPLMFLMNNNTPIVPTCACGGNCSCSDSKE